jgi:carboxyl-terminal processing protease
MQAGQDARQTRRKRDSILNLRPQLRSVIMSFMLIIAMGVGAGLDRIAIENGIVGAQDSFTELEDFDILADTYDLIRENYVESDEISDQDLVYGAASGMINALGDTGHSTFMDPEQARNYELSSQGKLIGIGVSLDYTGGIVTVVAPVDNSPAFDAGIRSGDVILEVDGTSFEGVSEADLPLMVTDLIRGEAGTDVTLKLQHLGETEPYEVTITRAEIELDPVSWKMLPNNVMWLRLSQFSAGSTEAVREALREGKAAGAEAVIFDLRNNPGGLVFEAIGVNSQFLPNGTTMYQQQDKDGDVKPVKTVGNDGEWLDGPLVVLINDQSASAAEITSSAMKAAGRAELLGETTFGTGTVLLPFKLDDGSIAMLGTHLWLTADGEQIWKKGVVPTVQVSLEPGVTVDVPALHEAEVIDTEEFSMIEDSQLTAGYDQALEEIEGN